MYFNWKNGPKWSKIRYRPARKRETVCSSRFDPRKRRRHSVEQILNPLQSFIFFFSLTLRACVRACVCVFRESIYVYVSLSLSLSLSAPSIDFGCLLRPSSTTMRR